MKMRVHLALMIGCCLAAPMRAAEVRVSDEAAGVVREDWERNERTLGRVVGSNGSIELLIERGLKTAGDLEAAGAKGAAEAGRKRLEEIRRRLGEIRQLAPSITTADGMTLVRCIICGTGQEGDGGRVQGQDYTFPMGSKWKGQDFGIRTVSWEKETVLYRLEGLQAGRKYRLRLFFTTDAPRKEEALADGRSLCVVEIKPEVAQERWADLPADITADGQVELAIKRLEGTHVVVSAIELWSDKALEDAAARRRAEALHARIERPEASTEGVALYREARMVVREMLFANPALDFDQLLFVRRQWPQIDHQCAHRVGESQLPGANLCILSGLRPDGTVRELLPAELAEKSGVGRPDLSGDAKRIVFPLARPRVPATGYPVSGGHGKYDPKNPTDSTAYRGGACHMYDIYEIGVDGTGLRRLTNDDSAEDTEPCYMPDGRICFTSSRDGRLVQCGDWALVFGLHVMDGDGGHQKPITEPQDTEFYPVMLDDGRILYTRWDYVMKGYNVIQQLWAVNPDGTKSQMVYGDWFTFSLGPCAMMEARQIPGTRKVVAVGSAHHNTAAGPIMIADLNQNRGGRDGMRNITPEIGYPEAFGYDERVMRRPEDLPAINNTSNPAGWYASPWPLSEKLFFVCYSYEMNDTARDGYGLYLMDTHGNRELIFRGKGWSCYAPIPLKGRPAAKVIPSVVAADPAAPGKLYVQDVYAGLDGVPRGTVKWLRICESYVKKRHTEPHRSDAGVSSGWDYRGVLGEVPVEEDGSASFEAPAGKLLFFEALDENHLEVRRMRNYVNLMPGESRGCVGCHESPAVSAISAPSPRATLREPSKIQPPPWGAGPMRFPNVVQPALDRHCISCHDGAAGKDKSFDLRGLRMVKAPTHFDGDEGAQHCVSDSFLALLPQVRYVKVGGYQGEKLPLKPYGVGSAASPLMQMLKKGHYGVKLPDADWQALAAWIDCNAPYYGSYDEIETTPR